MDWHRKSGISISLLLDMLKDLTGVEKVNYFIFLEKENHYYFIIWDSIRPYFFLIIYNYNVRKYCVVYLCFFRSLKITRCQKKKTTYKSFNFYDVSVNWIFYWSASAFCLSRCVCHFFFFIDLLMAMTHFFTITHSSLFEILWFCRINWKEFSICGAHV